MEPIALFQDPSGDCLENIKKAQGSGSEFLLPALAHVSSLNEPGGIELYPPDPFVSEPDEEDLQIPGISPLQIGENQWSEDKALGPQILGLG